MDLEDEAENDQYLSDFCDSKSILKNFNNKFDRNHDICLVFHISSLL